MSCPKMYYEVLEQPQCFKTYSLDNSSNRKVKPMLSFAHENINNTKFNCSTNNTYFTSGIFT